MDSKSNYVEKLYNNKKQFIVYIITNIIILFQFDKNKI